MTDVGDTRKQYEHLVGNPYKSKSTCETDTYMAGRDVVIVPNHLTRKACTEYGSKMYCTLSNLAHDVYISVKVKFILYLNTST
jgi:hypothetical protein